MIAYMMARTVRSAGGVVVLALTLTMLLPAPAAQAQSMPKPLWRIEAPTKRDARYFGLEVAMAGDRLIVGSSSGAFIYRLTEDAPKLEARLPQQVAPEEELGIAAVAIDGDRCILGFSRRTVDGQPAPRTLIYRRSGTTWGEETVLQVPGQGDRDDCGRAVAIAGDICVIGCPWDNAICADCGSIHIFQRDAESGWSHIKALTMPGARPAQAFGKDIEVNGEYLMVTGGVSDDDYREDRIGSVQLFRRRSSNWDRLPALTPDAEQTTIRTHSYPVAADGNRLVVGGYRSGPRYSLSWYLFELKDGRWEQEYEFLHSLRQGGDRSSDLDVFGDDVLLSVNSVMASEVLVYRCHGLQWIQTASLRLGEVNPESFVMAVAAGERHCAVGNQIGYIGREVLGEVWIWETPWHDVPQPMTDTELRAMSTEETELALRRIAELRVKYRDEDPRLAGLLQDEFQRVIQHKRSGSVQH